MTLTNIEYGSLASSEVLNKNFSYLEKKVDEAFNATMTSISSMLSNIATINSRLSEQTEMLENNSSEITAKLEEYKNKTKIFIKKTCSLPYWEGITAIDLTQTYPVTMNGYFLIIPEKNSEGDVKINNTIINYNNSGIVLLPVKEGDKISSNISLQNAFFVPVINIIFDNF